MPEPVVGEDGFDQFGLGPMVRWQQIQDGVYPTVRREKPWRPTLPLSAYGEPVGPERIEVRVNLDGVVMRSEFRRLKRKLRREIDALADAVGLERDRGR